MDADNYIANDFLRQLLVAAGTDKTVAAVYPTMQNVGQDASTREAAPFDFDTLRREPFMDACALLRVLALRQIGGYNPPLRDGAYHEDWASYLKLTARGWKCGNAPEATLFYRIHDSNWMRSIDWRETWIQYAKERC